MEQSAKQQLVERINSTNNILITVSNNPSVDQLSAAIGLTVFLNKVGKHATAVFSGEVPNVLEFLKPEETIEKNTNSLRDFIIALDKSKADKLRYKVEDKVVKIFITPYKTSLGPNDLIFSEGDFNVDVVIALGVKKKEDLDTAITAHGRILHDATVFSLVADKDNNNLGAVNWHEPTSSSLCELVADLAESIKPASMDAQIATAFLTGIVAETQRFSNAKTTPKSMSLSSKLMAAGANQQLIVSKIETVAQPVATKPPIAKAAPNEGAMAIPHTEPEAPAKPAEEDKELPDLNLEDDSSIQQIKIDDQGNLRTAEEIKKDQASRMALHPPTLGGTLTANSRPEDLEPSTDPMSAAAQSKILSHEDHSTLSDIEKSVNSPHVDAQAAPPIDTSAADIDSARNAVHQAAIGAEPQRPEPISALGASPLDMNVQGHQTPSSTANLPTPTPVEPVMSNDITMPAPNPIIAPSTNLEPKSPSLPPFMQDKGEPPEATGTQQPPTSPPPVPPPMMPPSLPSQ